MYYQNSNYLIPFSNVSYIFFHEVVAGEPITVEVIMKSDPTQLSALLYDSDGVVFVEQYKTWMAQKEVETMMKGVPYPVPSYPYPQYPYFPVTYRTITTDNTGQT